jgi:magnesium chelatase subunit H
VVGKPPSAEEAIATLVNIAGLDREEDGIMSLQRIIADSLGRDIEEIYRNSDRGVLADVQLLYDINQGVRAAVAALVHEQIDAEGRVSMVSRLNFFNIGRKEPWIKALHEAGYTNVNADAIKPLMEYLEFCLEQVCADNELGGLLQALEGEYILPGPGGDPIRNPEVLPTGKNIHALDPQSIPTTAASAGAAINDTAKASPMVPPMIAIARVRTSSRVESARNAVTAAEIAPAPCSARPTASHSIVVAIAATKLPNAKIASPTRMTRRRP